VALSGPDVGVVLARLGTAIEGARPNQVRSAAAAAVREHRRVITVDSGGDGRLSGVGRAKGRPGNARVGVVAKRDRVVDGMLVTATGPLQIVNNDTAGRVVTSAYLRGRGRRSYRSRAGETVGQMQGPGLVGTGLVGDRRAVLNIPGVGFRRSARHPGTKGKRTWQRGEQAALPQVRKIMSSTMRAVVSKAARP
jgi:hypothetical protein